VTASLVRRAALLLMAVPAVASAQGQDHAATSLLDAARDGKLRAGKWTYVTRLIGEGQPRSLGFRTLEVRSSTYERTPAWLLVDTRRMATVTLAESLYVRRADLAPLLRAAHTADGESVTHFTHDSVSTSFSGPSGKSAVSTPNVPGVIPTTYLLEALTQSAPVGVGWRASAQLAALGRKQKQSGVIPVELRTVGEERILVPDGEFDCWLLSLKLGRSEQRIWVRKSDRVILKQMTPVINMPGAAVQLILAQGGAK
jgi:hypothetical protein